MISSATLKGICAYCCQPGRVCVCGDDHMTSDPIDLPGEKATMTQRQKDTPEQQPATKPGRGAPTTMPAAPRTTGTTEPVPLAEYEYMVGYIPTTAMLTPEQAEKLGATPVTPPPPPEGGEGEGEGGGEGTPEPEVEEGGEAPSRRDGSPRVGDEPVENNEAERMVTRQRQGEDEGVSATNPDGSTSADARHKARKASGSRAQR